MSLTGHNERFRGLLTISPARFYSFVVVMRAMDESEERTSAIIFISTLITRSSFIISLVSSRDTLTKEHRASIAATTVRRGERAPCYPFVVGREYQLHDFLL